MTDLSPAALAVWEAFNSEEPGVFVDYGDCIAAALRTAADQVVPEEAPPADFLDHAVAAEIDQRRTIRAELLAIAAELETSTTENR